MSGLQTLKFMSNLVLMGCLLTAPQAFGKEWDLSETKPKQPECLNCCMSPLHQDQCDLESEKRLLESFSEGGFLGYIGVMALISSMLTVGTLNYRPVFSVILAPISTSLISYMILMIKKHLTNSESHPFETETGEPEGLVLWVNAEDDWNGALASPNTGSLQKRHLVLYYTASYFSDISDAIRNIRTRFDLPIRALVLNAHGGWFGSNFQMLFGDEFLEMSNLYRIQEVISLLDKDSAIFLKSCKAGGKENFEVLSQADIVQAIASIADGRKVHSTADYSSPWSEIQPDLSTARYRGPSTAAFHLFEVLSFNKLDLEYLFDYPRCYQSTPNGEIRRCS